MSRAVRIDDPLRRGADEVAAVLRKHGFQACFAGGCVRDLLLGLTPKDYDVATDATPEQVQRTFKRTVLVGASFGVVRVIWPGQREYEVATFRTEGAYLDGRRPTEVQYTRSREEDVERRDFTINALLLDPETDEVLDHVGGLADLDARVIRAVGDAARRFAEDKLRMLRAVRFAARLGFAIEEATAQAIRLHAGDLAQVSVERIVAELHATWATTRPGQGMRLAHALGLWPVMFPWLGFSEDLVASFARLPDARARFGLDADRTALVGWALLLDRAPAVDPEAVLRDHKLSRDLMRGVLGLLGVRDVLDAADQASLVARARVLAAPEAPTARAYAEARWGAASATVQALDAHAADHAARPLPSMPLVTGADLKALGLPPGPAFKAILAAVEDAVLERRITTRDEALALASAAAPVATDPSRR